MLMYNHKAALLSAFNLPKSDDGASVLDSFYCRKDAYAEIPCANPPALYGDVKFVFYHAEAAMSGKKKGADDSAPRPKAKKKGKDKGGGGEVKMFTFWINTFFVKNKYVQLQKVYVDGATKDRKQKHFLHPFFVELFFD
jgi:hypothetical protein